MSKRTLGRGIDALIAGSGTGEESGSVINVAVSALEPGAHQPRKGFPEESLEELARSIEQKGILQPILAESLGGGRYRIVAGERRLRAARMAGLREVPVIVREFSELEKTEIALVENLQREDLSPVEEANGYKTLIERGEMTQDEVAKRVGKNRSTVANSLRLLKLPAPMIEALDQGKMTPGHARAILSLVNPADQELLFQRIVAREMSVREAEATAGRLSRGQRGSGKKAAAKPRQKTPELASLEQRLIERLGTKTAIRGSENRGKIEIHYFSLDDLERISSLILD